MSDLTLTCRRTIHASPERVYSAWIDPAMMTRFMSPGLDMHVREARADARAGGRFFGMMVGDKHLLQEGTCKVLTPHSRIVFPREAPRPAPDTRVELLLTPAAAGTGIVPA